MGSFDLHYLIKHRNDVSVMNLWKCMAGCETARAPKAAGRIAAGYIGTIDGLRRFSMSKLRPVTSHSSLAPRAIRELLVDLDMSDANEPAKIMAINEEKRSGTGEQARVDVEELKKLDPDTKLILVAFINEFGLESDAELCPIAQEAVELARLKRMGIGGDGKIEGF
jgi:hypothetical protein